MRDFVREQADVPAIGGSMHLKKRLLCTVAGIAAVMSIAPPAHAQVIVDTIGQAVGNSIGTRRDRLPESCIRGEPPSQRRLASALEDAEGAMRLYLVGAGSGAPADVSAAFSRRPRVAYWTVDGQESPVSAVHDPLAQLMTSGTGRVGSASAFVRSGDGHSALGIWQLMAADGTTRLGHYRASFLRESRTYRIAELEVVQGAVEPAPISQYCATPGDVDEEARLLREEESAPPKSGLR